MDLNTGALAASLNLPPTMGPFKEFGLIPGDRLTRRLGDPRLDAGSPRQTLLAGKKTGE